MDRFLLTYLLLIVTLLAVNGSWASQSRRDLSPIFAEGHSAVAGEVDMEGDKRGFVSDHLWRRDSVLQLAPTPDMTDASWISSFCSLLSRDVTSVIIDPALQMGFSYPPCLSSSRTVTSLKIRFLTVNAVSDFPTSLNTLDASSLIFITTPSAYSWSQVWDYFPNLQSLRLKGCGIAGYLPDSLPPNTTLLDLSQNRFIGNIPYGFLSNFTGVSTPRLELRLDDNLLTGTIPTYFSAFLNATSTFLFSASGNRLSGSLPEVLFPHGTAMSHFEFDVSNNLISGTLPLGLLGYTPNLNNFTLDISKNSLTGSLPFSILSFTTSDNASVVIDLSDNLLSGGLDVNFISSAEMPTTNVVLSIARNSIGGTIPETLFSGFKIKSLYFDVTGNKLIGSIPATLFAMDVDPTIVTNLTAIFSQNLLSGSVPSFLLEKCTTANETIIASVSPSSLPAFTVAFDRNLLNGTLPSRLFEHCNASSISMSFEGNAISGTVPIDLFSIDLTYSARVWSSMALYASNNLLKGPLPSSLFKTSVNIGAITFDASSNALSGSFPSGLFNIDTAESITLLLGSNQISGVLPTIDMLTTSSKALTVDLSSNYLDGSLPIKLCSVATTLPALSLALENNSLSGQIEESSLTSCSPATLRFTAHNNQFSGSIPNSLFFAYKLQSIDWRASNNSFSRWQSLNSSASPNLVAMDLSRNLLVEIPDDITLSALTKLTYVNVSGNSKITGPLPGSSAYHDSGVYDFSGCSFDGQLPDMASGSCPNTFLASRNKLSSSFPSSWVSCINSLGSGNSGGFTSYIDISGNAGITGTLPASLFNDTLLRSFSASSTGLTGIMPLVSNLTGVSTFALDLSSTLIDFCSPSSRSAWAWSSPSSTSATIHCNLLSTSAESCHALYPMCETNWTPNWTPTQSCLASTRPSPAFVCINGIWTSPTVTTTTLTVPSGAGTVIISGNLTSSQVVIQGGGTTLQVSGCANVSLVTIELTTTQLEEISKKGGLLSQTLIQTSANSTCDTDLTSSSVQAKVSGSSCRKLTTTSSSTASSLSAVFTVNSSSCNIWWIVVVSVVSVLIIAGLVIAIVLLQRRAAHARPKLQD